MRVKGRAEVGKVHAASDGYVSVIYDHGGQRVTFGDYPAAHVERVEAVSHEEAKEAKAEIPSLPSPPSRDTKPRASTKDIIPATTP